MFISTVDLLSAVSFGRELRGDISAVCGPTSCSRLIPSRPVQVLVTSWGFDLSSQASSDRASSEGFSRPPLFSTTLFGGSYAASPRSRFATTGRCQNAPHRRGHRHLTLRPLRRLLA